MMSAIFPGSGVSGPLFDLLRAARASDAKMGIGFGTKPMLEQKVRASDPKVETGFGANPMLEQKDEAARGFRLKARRSQMRAGLAVIERQKP
jgi:hypothetical protein